VGFFVVVVLGVGGGFGLMVVNLMYVSPYKDFVSVVT